jgi:diguanylate cyclase (GGDEF)-like protein
VSDRPFDVLRRHANLPRSSNEIVRALFRPTNLPAVIATAVVILFGVIVDKQSRQLATEKARADLLSQVTLIRTKLEADINGDIALVRGLVSIISTEPDMTQARFAELASGLIEERPQIRDIVGARNLAVNLKYPPELNDNFIEANPTNNDDQRVLALRARDSLGVVIVGPITLTQGGTGFVARFPVFAKGDGDTRSFWGIVEAVIDGDRLYRDVGLLAEKDSFDVAISNENDMDGDGATFFGDASVKKDRPVMIDVRLPSTHWRIAATPNGGWNQPRPGDWLPRLIVAAAGLLLILPTWLIGRLVEERRHQVLKLRDRETDLRTRNAELEIARERIEYTALHDFLTKLPNRRYLQRVLDEHAIRCAQTGTGIVLLHVDLDRFKQINDTMGHIAGDAMLLRTVGIIKGCLRDDDFIARTGGDEFVIVCTGEPDVESFTSLAQRMIDGVREPAEYDGHECRFGISVGIASAFGSEVDGRRLLVNADIALYRAKRLGGNRAALFTEALQLQIINDKRTADEIMRGLERGEFVPFFQPQFDARTFELVGIETLARWRNPSRGYLAPSEFLSIAEELGVVSTIDRLIFEQGLSQFNRWRESGLRVPRLSANVSLRRLQDEGLLEGLRKLNIQPGTVSFELLETIYLDERDDHFSTIINRIRALGVEIEIDDFGTGYASILSLIKLRPNRLKIDRQLVMPIVRSPAQRHLIQSIVDIGASLKIDIVAEGVETMDHAQVLRDLGCNTLQGYAFAKPMEACELTEFLSVRARKVAS